jgi:hypothetical protein
MRNLNDRIAALRGRIAAQEGLSIIEMAVALGVMFISLLALARTATVAFSDTANSRQRQTGSQFANQLLEQVAGLPWETLQKGLATSDAAGDPDNIVSCSGTYRYQDCSGEEIQHTDYPAGSEVSPLVPNTGTVESDPGTYSWRIYVTKPTVCSGSTPSAGCVPSAGGYRVIAIVDWEDRARQGLRSEVEAQTIRYSPSGCGDTATHTVSGPCSAYFYATGRAGGGTVNTTGTWSDGDTPFDSLTMTLLAETADAQVESVSKVEGDVSLPTLIKIVGGVETSETDSTASAADTDPATPAGTYFTSSTGPGQTGRSIQLIDSGDKLTLSFGGGSLGKSTSATAAGGLQPCNNQVDGKACGYSEGTQSGGMTQTIDLKDPGLATLISVASATAPTTTYVRREAPAGQNGLVRETVTWTLPEIRIGGLSPNSLIPSAIGASGGWQGYWARLRNFSATAVAESGTGTTAPTVTINSGTIDAWHGNGYNSYPVTTAGGTAMMSSVSQKTKVTGEWQQVDISGEVSWEPSTTSQLISGGTTRTEAKATIGSPLVVEMKYVVTDDGQKVADLTIQLTAGRGEVTTRYKVGGA